MNATHTNQTTEILASGLPANEKIQALRGVRRDLRGGIKSLTDSGAESPEHRYHAVLTAMQAEFEAIDAGLVDLYCELAAVNA